MPDKPRTAYAAPIPYTRDPEKLCSICERPYGVGQHHQHEGWRDCTAPGCRKRLLEWCLLDGRIVGSRCRGGAHTLRFP